MKEFFKALFRSAVAFFLALIALVIAIGIYSWVKGAYDSQQAKPFEEVKEWRFDLKHSIGVDTLLRTKLIAGTLLVSVEVIGYPKYFSDPRNLNGSLNFEFLDKDSFEIISKPVKISEFTTVVDKDGKESGLSYQFNEYIDLDEYKRFSRLQVGWNLITKPIAQTITPKPILDHCAPSISKAERLKRLEQHGIVRETGPGNYSAGGHSVSFFTYDGSLTHCQ